MGVEPVTGTGRLPVCPPPPFAVNTVRAIKHCPHGHETGGANSDGDKLYRAGEVGVIASSPDKWTLVERAGHDGSLESLLSSLDLQTDLVIVEGFKSSPVPKILVLDDEQIPVSITNVIATIGHDRAASEVPAYTFENLDYLAAMVLEVFLESPQDRLVATKVRY